MQVSSCTSAINYLVIHVEETMGAGSGEGRLVAWKGLADLRETMADMERAAVDEGDGTGPWFRASFAQDCARCGGEVEPGDRIRADGDGGYECCGG